MPDKKDLTTQKHILTLANVLISPEEREKAKPKTKEVTE